MLRGPAPHAVHNFLHPTRRPSAPVFDIRLEPEKPCDCQRDNSVHVATTIRPQIHLEQSLDPPSVNPHGRWRPSSLAFHPVDRAPMYANADDLVDGTFQHSQPQKNDSLFHGGYGQPDILDRPSLANLLRGHPVSLLQTDLRNRCPAKAHPKPYLETSASVRSLPYCRARRSLNSSRWKPTEWLSVARRQHHSRVAVIGEQLLGRTPTDARS